MAGKKKEKKIKAEEAEPKSEPDKKIIGYEVVAPIWLRGVQRYPGYQLDIEDKGYKGEDGLKHLVNIGAIKEIYELV